MFDKPKATQTMGLQLGHSTLKVAELRFAGGRASLDQVFEIEVDLEHKEVSEKANPLEITQDGRHVHEILGKHLAVTALDTHQVIIRPLEVKLTKLRDVDSVLAFQAEPLLPYAAEDTLLDRVVLKKDGESTKLILFATRNEYLEDHLEIWQHLKIEPEVITCTPAALTTFANHFHDTENPFFAIHLGIAETTCILVKEKKLRAAYTNELNLFSLIEAYAEDRGFEDPEEAQKALLEGNFEELKKYPKLQEKLNQWQLDTTKTLYALGKQVQNEELGPILITGEGGALQGLASFLCEKISQTIAPPISNPRFPISTDEMQKFAVAIGMGLSALPKEEDEINFRQQAFAYPNPWKRLKKPLLLYLGSAFLLAFGFYIFGNQYLTSKEDALKEEYASLAAYTHKPYRELETEYIKKNPGASFTLEIENLNLEQLRSRINYLENTISAQPESFPLQPNIPRVTDVLAWLSTHPNVVKDDNPLIEIESFQYTMLKRPDKNKKNEKYQVKVDLEFTSPSPKYAREFHDALISPNHLVDPLGEVKWNASQGKYRTSFILKDRTAYTQKGGS